MTLARRGSRKGITIRPRIGRRVRFVANTSYALAGFPRDLQRPRSTVRILRSPPKMVQAGAEMFPVSRSWTFRWP